MPTLRRSTLRTALATGVLAPALALALLGCGGGDDSAADEDRQHAAQPKNPDGAPCAYTETGPADKDADLPADTAAYDGEVSATIETGEGDIPITLDAARAPCTVNSFTSLASQGYFDDTECHRLTTDGIYVLQCGDPTASGRGGPGYAFADELQGDESYAAGALAMANTGQPNTNGSQFFIVYDDSVSLPPDYTVFGSVDPDGLEVVTKITEAGSDEAFGPGDGAPNTDVDIEWLDIAAQ